MRIRVGDTVIWDEGPNQFRANSPGRVLRIPKGIAYIDCMYSSKIRKVPVKILRKEKQNEAN